MTVRASTPHPNPPPQGGRGKKGAQTASTAAMQPSDPSGFSVYLQPRVLIVAAMGFASGLPLLLTLSTLSLWLAEAGIDKTTIGLFALVGLPYSIKFLWSPVIDRMPLPPFTTLLGRRRGWAIAIQALLILAILAMALTDPRIDAGMTALAALAIAFFSASQDIVIDAYRIEILEEREQGAGAAATQAGYRIGLLASGAGALFIASAFGWFAAFAAMAALMGLSMIIVLIAPEPPASSTVVRASGIAAQLKLAVFDPLAEFFTRSGWLPILAFILLYKFGDAFAGVMANPFYVEMGFTKVEIASVSKVFGLIATLAGVFIGGAVVARIGVLRALLWCGLLQMLSNLMFAAQALAGHDILVLFATIGLENFSGGMGSAAFVAYLSVLCNLAYTATQYALLSSFMSFGRTFLSSSSGWIADHVDWVQFFVISTVLAVPGLMLLLWMMRRYPVAAPVAPAPVASE
jgi:MFS transporter, PAT family, beta-lactamase induction signal transducer AmpG